jgi:hypothetical protein
VTGSPGEQRNGRDEFGCGSAQATVVAAWIKHDAAQTLHATDREVILATEAVRWLVVDLFGPAAPARDLFTACARLGGLMAAAGASPSLAANTIDCAVRALADVGAPFAPERVGAARASLVEGFVAAVRDAERDASARDWEYPACAVPLASDAVAIACGHPVDDAEALAAWAARVAGALVKARVRRVFLAGSERARSEMANAAELVGIAIASAASPAREPTEKEPAAKEPGAKSWLRLPWRK